MAFMPLFMFGWNLKSWPSAATRKQAFESDAFFGATNLVKFRIFIINQAVVEIGCSRFLI